MIFKKIHIFLKLSVTAIMLIIASIAFSDKSIVNMGYPINTRGDDFAPSITENGRYLLFNSKEPRENNHSIYFCELKNGSWSKPEYFTILNSQYDDESPYVSHDGKVILFSSNRENGIYNIYISEKLDGKWTTPIKIPGDVNTTANERTPSLSKDKKTLYYSRWPSTDMSLAKVMSATLENGQFTKSNRLPYPVNSGNYEIGMVPSRNYSGFYFASRRSKGHGGWDLYFVAYKHGKFGKPVNLGHPINTEDNEMFLTETVDEDIIICTNRGGGYGKYDIYITKLPPLIRKAIRKSVREIKKYDQGIIFRSGRIRKRTVPDKSKKTYMKEKSILTVKKKKDDKKIKDTKDTKDKKKGTSLVNKKVNKKDDNKIIKNGDTKKNNSNDDTIISKNDNNKKLNNDSSKKFDHLKDDGIKVKKNVEKTKVFVTFLDKKSKKPIDVKVYVYLKDTEDPVAEELRSVVRRTNDEGTVRIIPKYDVRFIVLKLKAYNPQFRKSIKVTWGTHSKLTVYVDKYDFTSDNSDDIVKMREKCFNYTKTGIKLCPIYFNFNSAYIRISYYPYLHTIIRYLRKNRKARITIYGHSDYYGGTFINKKLSYKRARAVRRFFLRFGISPYRIRIMGMGDKCPRTGQNELYSNYMNRRVEFKIF